MTEVSASLVKSLREKTGAGMMDCKKALAEVDGNLDAAVDWLRKKGLSAAAKKADRVAAEGLIAVSSSSDEKIASIIEVNAETDFVARNPQFQSMVEEVAKISLIHGNSVDGLLKSPFSAAGETVQDEISRLIGLIGENMNLRRSMRVEVENGVVATYMHSIVASGLGKIGVLVALESEGDKDKLKDLGKKIAMHIAAASPQFLSVSDVDPQALQRERDVLIEQAASTGRPQEVISKMVEGRIRKYYEEVVLLEQTYVIDGKTKISDVVAQTSKDLECEIKLKNFVRFNLGEGIEKQESDFAAEVASQANCS